MGVRLAKALAPALHAALIKMMMGMRRRIGKMRPNPERRKSPSGKADQKNQERRRMRRGEETTKVTKRCLKM